MHHKLHHLILRRISIIVIKLILHVSSGYFDSGLHNNSFGLRRKIEVKVIPPPLIVMMKVDVETSSSKRSYPSRGLLSTSSTNYTSFGVTK